MKFLALALLALVAVASAKYIDFEDVIDLEDITAYGYLSKHGIAAAERIRLAEEQEQAQSRIVGGSNSNVGQFPYQAGLLAQFAQGQGVCGGSLLRANRVLTAAHCWFDGQNQATSFTVVLGSVFLFSGGTRVSTNNVVMHGSWIPTLIRNDVAIIRLNSNVGLSNTIAVIALPTGNELNENYAGENAIASGFGLTNDGGGISNNQALSHVTLPVITNLVCRLSFPLIVQDSNICTSGAGGRSTCQGDSGGPLVVNRSGRPILPPWKTPRKLEVTERYPTTTSVDLRTMSNGSLSVQLSGNGSRWQRDVSKIEGARWGLCLLSTGIFEIVNVAQECKQQLKKYNQ